MRMNFKKRYNTGHPRPKYSEGDIIVIYCHKGNPEKVLVENDKLRFTICIVFISVGIFIIIKAASRAPIPE